MTTIQDDLDLGVDVASHVFRVSRHSILGRQRPPHVCLPRFAVYSWLRYKGHTLLDISAALGRSSHKSAQHGIKTMKAIIDTEPWRHKDLADFTEQLGVSLNEFVSTVWPETN